jgi:hypothetical protein
LLTIGCNLNAARRRLITILLSFALAAAPAAASAQDAADIVKFLAGGAIGLGIHEAGHVVVNLATGVTPGIKGVSYGPFRFFAITHESVPPAREFAISSAGFWSQHIGSELILASRPHLRDEAAPLLKGVLAFNVLASAVYSGAAFARTGPPERDTRGMAVSADVREPWIGVWLLAPAALDTARYYHPDAAWLRWASRAMKVGGALLIVRAVD